MLGKTGIHLLGRIVESFNRGHRLPRRTLSAPENCSVVIIVLNLDNIVAEQFYHIREALEFLKVMPFMFPNLLSPAALVTPVPPSHFPCFRVDELCFESHRRATNKVISRRTRLLILD